MPIQDKNVAVYKAGKHTSGKNKLRLLHVLPPEHSALYYQMAASGRPGILLSEIAGDAFIDEPVATQISDNSFGVTGLGRGGEGQPTHETYVIEFNGYDPIELQIIIAALTIKTKQNPLQEPKVRISYIWRIVEPNHNGTIIDSGAWGEWSDKNFKSWGETYVLSKMSPQEFIDYYEKTLGSFLEVEQGSLILKGDLPGDVSKAKTRGYEGEPVQRYYVLEFNDGFDPVFMKELEELLIPKKKNPLGLPFIEWIVFRNETGAELDRFSFTGGGQGINTLNDAIGAYTRIYAGLNFKWIEVKKISPIVHQWIGKETSTEIRLHDFDPEQMEAIDKMIDAFVGAHKHLSKKNPLQEKKITVQKYHDPYLTKWFDSYVYANEEELNDLVPTFPKYRALLEDIVKTSWRGFQSLDYAKMDVRATKTPGIFKIIKPNKLQVAVVIMEGFSPIELQLMSKAIKRGIRASKLSSNDWQDDLKPWEEKKKRRNPLQEAVLELWFQDINEHGTIFDCNVYATWPREEFGDELDEDGNNNITPLPSTKGEWKAFIREIALQYGKVLPETDTGIFPLAGDEDYAYGRGKHERTYWLNINKLDPISQAMFREQLQKLK